MSIVKTVDDGIITTGGSFTWEQHKKMVEAEKEKPLYQPQPQPEIRTCPFSGAYNKACKKENCAVFVNGVCAFGGGAPIQATEGKICPIIPEHTPCKNTCALYQNGCSINR